MFGPHPNLLDKFFLRIYPQYLYPGQPCQAVATVNVGIVHRIPDKQPYWKIMDYLYLKKGSTMTFIDLARNLHLNGDVLPAFSVLELVNPEVDEMKSFGKIANPTDMICITPYDRQFIMAAPQDGPQEGPPISRLADIIAPPPSA